MIEFQTTFVCDDCNVHKNVKLNTKYIHGIPEEENVLGIFEFEYIKGKVIKWGQTHGQNGYKLLCPRCYPKSLK